MKQMFGNIKSLLIIGEHATSMDALWALRDFMLQEALGVVKIM